MARKRKHIQIQKKVVPTGHTIRQSFIGGRGWSMHTRILVDGEPVTDWVNEQDRELHEYKTLEGETKTRSTLYLLSEMTKFKIGVSKLKRILDKAKKDYYRQRAEKYGMTVREAKKKGERFYVEWQGSGGYGLPSKRDWIIG